MGSPDPHKWYDEKADNPPRIRALAEVRHRATREGYCYRHVQAIIVAIDQYAERALGNREYFLNRTYRALALLVERRSTMNRERELQQLLTKNRSFAERSKLSDRGLVDFRRVCEQMDILDRETDTIRAGPSLIARNE